MAGVIRVLHRGSMYAALGVLYVCLGAFIAGDLVFIIGRNAKHMRHSHPRRIAFCFFPTTPRAIEAVAQALYPKAWHDETLIAHDPSRLRDDARKGARSLIKKLTFRRREHLYDALAMAQPSPEAIRDVFGVKR
jgi:hypothetical protein